MLRSLIRLCAPDVRNWPSLCRTSRSFDGPAAAWADRSRRETEPCLRERYFRTLAASLLAILLLVGTSELRAEPNQPPNIILIMADDMGYECVSANGGETYSTPHLDRLAESGMRFEHCYSQPICTASRVQIMTGIYNSRNYVRFGLLKQGSDTFGNLLRDVGYETCIVGKWQLEGGFEGPHEFGFDEYSLWQLTRIRKDRPNRYPNPGLEINGHAEDFRNGEYGPDLVSDYACEFIDRHAGGEKPFLVYYPMILPHFPFEPTPDSPEWDPTARREDDVEEGKAPHTDRRFFRDMVHYVDKIVGRLVARLEQHNLQENTLILFTCDNGTHVSITSRFQGRDWEGGKGHMMDNGTHVPLIASWPGTIPAGRINSDLIDFSDILPTLAEAAGIPIPSGMEIDGRSFLPQLRGEPGDPREWIYCWYFRDGEAIPGGPEHKAGESARTLRYKLYRDGGFFDVPNDFYERDPLDPAQLSSEEQAVRSRLQQVIDKHTRPGFYSDKEQSGSRER